MLPVVLTQTLTAYIRVKHAPLQNPVFLSHVLIQYPNLFFLPSSECEYITRKIRNLKCFDIFGHKFRNGYSLLTKRAKMNFTDQIPPYLCVWNNVLLPAFQLVRFLNLVGKMSLYDCVEKIS